VIGADAALAAHIASRSTTLAVLWLVTRSDAAVFGFTSHDRDLVVGGVTYVARYGITPSALQSGATLAVTNSELGAVFSAEGMTPDDLRAGVWDFADVRIRWCNWADLTQGVAKMQRGWLGEVRHDGFKFTAEMLGLTTVLNRSRGRVVTAACDAFFGDARCGLDLAPYTTAGEVSAVTSQREVVTDVTGAAADLYAGGEIVWTSGANDGRRMELKGNDDSGTLTLALPMVGAIQVGDTFNVIRGCAKSASACGAYGNLDNFRGFQFVPGPDRAFKAGGQ
jgi:uncharacterized phage protein (TIGR02218 family)